MKWRALHTVWLLLIIGVLTQLFSLDYYKDHNHVRGDGLAYYSYLPATFIYQDPANRFYADLDGYEQQKYWLNEGREGAYLPKMTMGLALLWAPGYAVAHVLAPVMGFPQDGWSAPYKLSVLITSLLALLLGVSLIFKLLQKRFSNFISGLSVLLMVFGTHLLHYGVSEVSMSHIYTFALVAAFTFVFDRWLVQSRRTDLPVMGLLFGLIVLIRPTNAVILLLPLALLIQGSFKLKRLFNWTLLPALLLALVPVLLQSVFWKETTGNWIYYSYTEEAIYWLQPHFIEGLFSYRNGWLLYTPLFLLVIPGYISLRRVDPKLALASLSVLIVHAYITFSWWCWYYGDSLSIRPMIDMYPVLAIALASGLWYVLRQRAIISTLSAIVIILLTYNNLLFIKHYNEGKLTGSTMSKTAFWSLFLTPQAPSHLGITLAYEEPDNMRLRKGMEERTSPDTTVQATFSITPKDQEMVKVSSRKEYGPSVSIEGEALRTAQDEYIRFTFRMKLDETPQKHPILVFSFEDTSGTRKYEAVGLQDMDIEGGEWTNQSFYLRWPDEVTADLQLKHYMWNKYKGDHTIELVSVSKVRIAYE